MVKKWCFFGVFLGVFWTPFLVFLSLIAPCRCPEMCPKSGEKVIIF